MQIRKRGRRHGFDTSQRPRRKHATARPATGRSSGPSPHSGRVGLTGHLKAFRGIRRAFAAGRKSKDQGSTSHTPFPRLLLVPRVHLAAAGHWTHFPRTLFTCPFEPRVHLGPAGHWIHFLLSTCSLSAACTPRTRWPLNPLPSFHVSIKCRVYTSHPLGIGSTSHAPFPRVPLGPRELPALPDHWSPPPFPSVH